MPRYRPTAYIRSRQRFQGKTIDDLKPEELAALQQRIDKLQSNEPLVTIALIAKNEEDGIISTFDSLSETKSKYPIEIVVIDNNSTDRTPETIKACGVRYVPQPTPGIPETRQMAVEAARGKYVISGDADTLYQPSWVDALIDPMEKDQNIVCTYTLHAFFTEDGKYPFGLILYQWTKYFSVLLKNMQRPHLVCGGASMAFRKEEALKVGGYDLTKRRGSDGTMAFDLSKLGRIHLVRSSKGMIWTSMRRTMMDGGLWSAFWIRFRQNMKPFFEYFTPQKEK